MELSRSNSGDEERSTTKKRRPETDESSDDDMETVDVDFEWFDPQPVHDFHGLKNLLRQLLDVDAPLFDTAALADLILSQPLLGSTVKVYGNKTDPYAFLTVLNMYQHQDKDAIRQLKEYLVRKATGDASLSRLEGLFPGTDDAAVGLVLTERLLNMPPQVVPPMYKMLQEEISWALEAKEPYAFSHYLILSKAYREVESTLVLDDERSSRKRRKKGGPEEGADTVFYFHPEDEVLQRHALGHCFFEYTNQHAQGSSDAKRTFSDLGIVPQGHLILIEAKQFPEAVKAIEAQFKNQ